MLMDPKAVEVNISFLIQLSVAITVQHRYQVYREVPPQLQRIKIWNRRPAGMEVS